jgi:hypothetical protein
MEILYFTAIAIGLYAFSDWLLGRIEQARGRRFANRQLVFFAIILVLALVTFQFMGALLRPSGPSPEAPPPGKEAPRSPR